MTEAPRQEESIASKATIETLYVCYKGKLNNATDKIKREILQTFVRSITILDEELEIKVALSVPEDAFAGQHSHTSSPQNGIVELIHFRP
jgi:hypothetical protein